MTDTTSGAPTPRAVTTPNWPLAVSSAAIGAFLMLLAGGLLVPFGRLFVSAVYGIVERAVLRPFGVGLPGIVPFVLVNFVILAAALATGRRVGAILAFRSVEGRLGDARLLYGAALVAGIAGAAAFVVAVPWSGAPAPDLSWIERAVYLALGHLFHLAVLLASPPWGVNRYLAAHPPCPRCWVWLERETGGGAFRLADAPRVTTAIRTGDVSSLRDLPVADPSLPGAACSLEWWTCPSCRAEAFVSCLPGVESPPILSTRLTGQPVADLRAVISYRRALADPRPTHPPPSAAGRA